MGNSKFAFISSWGAFKLNAAISPTPTTTVNKINVLVTYRISFNLYEAILFYIKALCMESCAAKLPICAFYVFQW